MLSTIGKIETGSATENTIKAFWILVISLLVVFLLSLYQLWQPITLVNVPVLSSLASSTENQKEVRSWLLNYSDLRQAQERHQAFRDLMTILQNYENSAQEIEILVLLDGRSSMELLAVTVGVLSSQGTPQNQQVLCHALQVFRNNPEKVMLVLPQIMLLEEPQDFVFDELQTFIHTSHHPVLRENAELALAGLSQHAYQTNQPLAQKITLWLESKKTILSDNPQSLSTFLDLLGNTGNETFLADVLQATTHQDAGVRARAAFALRLFKGEQANRALKKLEVDQDSEVKTKATEALRYFHLN